MGYLMRRNVLAYKAPPGNDGYDLICVHPESMKATRQLRVQVKSRLPSDHGSKSNLVREHSINSFDYLVVVFLNVGYFLTRPSQSTREGLRPPDFYTFSISFIREHHRSLSSWKRVLLRGDLDAYRNERGFDLIAADLDVAYPSNREALALQVSS